MNTNNLTSAIVNAILPYKKRSERMVGFLPYTLPYEIHRYQGTSKKPESISVLEKTIVNLVGKEVVKKTHIAAYLGLDLQDEIEKNIIDDALENLKVRLQLINETSQSIYLTETGTQYLTSGILAKTFSRSFDIYVNQDFIDFPFIKDCVKSNKKAERGEKINTALPLNNIKHIAQYQASFIHYPENGLELQSAKLIGISKGKLDVYVCFLQSIRDNSIRTVAYDAYNKVVIEELSDLFSAHKDLCDSLLKKCLKDEVKNEEAVEVKSGEKSTEQIEFEKKVIEDADKFGEEYSLERQSYDEKVGKIFDSPEFEKELGDIFETHRNQEIWLISPWIRNYAFLNIREPQIRKFLDQGGAIFIGYSEPERLGEEMVDSKSMNMVKNLDKNYDKFYFLELPKFHMKNVIEYKRGIPYLYTGSFNVLSFCINGSDKHFRMEQMSFANRKEAEERRLNYLKQFASKYFNESMEAIKKNGGTQNVDLSKLSYLKETGILEEIMQNFGSLAVESEINASNQSKTDTESLLSLSKKVLEDNYSEDSYILQARLAALTFMYEYIKNNKNKKLNEYFDYEFNRLLNRRSLYNSCRITLRKGKIDTKKSIVNIICNNLNFEFSEIILSPKIVSIITKHKVFINFAEENIDQVKYNLNEVLYNSAKAIGITIG